MLQQKVTDFVATRAGVSPSAVDSETLLFSEGLLDSLFALELVEVIEKEAGVAITPTEISLDNLDSISRIERFVAAKKAG